MPRVLGQSSSSRSFLAVCLTAAGLSAAGLALAQEQRAAADVAAEPLPEEVIVTARKREESLMETPVLMQAVGASQIQDLHIDDVYSIQAAVPGLQLSTAFAGVGSAIAMRGLGNGQAAVFVDQSVMLNIDGIGLSSGTFFRGGLFDLGQIEVLKGPQALFFGKSTSAGILSLHSADPTPEWQTQVRAGHEFVANETDLEGHVSGPITDDLGIRLAGYHNTAAGWLYNTNPLASAQRLPDETDDGVRLTLKYDNASAGLHARLKSSYNRVTSNMTGADTLDACSNGVSSVAIFNQYTPHCVLGKYLNPSADLPPYVPGTNFPAFDPTPFATATPSPLFSNGKPYQRTETLLDALEINYDIIPGLTLTSLSGYVSANTLDAGSGNAASIEGFYGLAGQIYARDYSEEVRLASNWRDSWINFMVGGLYNPETLKNRTAIPLPSFGIYTDNTAVVDTKNNSAFAQVTLTPIEKWELSAGARYTRVDKRIKSLVPLNNFSAAVGQDTNGLQEIQSIPEANRHIVQSATTPEFTLSFHPTENITTFASYKKGFKGPGFNISTTDAIISAATATTVSGEFVKGVEGGMKARLMDEHLDLTLTGYRYSYSGLQVAVPGPFLTIEIRPDADARVQGVEFGASYRLEQIHGLSVNSFLNYNDSHYTSFQNAPCWGGQLPSQGCVAGTQDLAGQRLSLAANWVGNLSIDYRKPLGGNYALGMNVGGQFTTNYNVVPELNPIGVQPGYALLDASVHLMNGESWDLALLGRNLTNRFYATSGADRGIAGTAAGVPGDAVLYIARARQVMLQVTVNPKF